MTASIPSSPEGLGEKLKAWRKANRLTQADVAALCEVSQPTVGRWEAGQSVPQGRAASVLVERRAVTLADIGAAVAAVSIEPVAEAAE